LLFYFPENSVNFIILSSSVQVIVQMFFIICVCVCVCVCARARARVNMVFVGMPLEGDPRVDTHHELRE